MARVPEAVQRQMEQVDAFDAEIAQIPQGETPPTPEVPAEPTPTPTPEPTAVDWQQKFQTLQGKYNAEVPQLRGQITALTQQVDQLRAQPPATPVPAAPTPVPPPAQLVTTEDTETYGSDLIDLIRRVAVETDAGEKAKLQGEIVELRRQMTAQATQVEAVAGNVTDGRRAQYFVDLAKEVPDYETVDSDDGFKAWLLLPDEFSGLIRNDILQTAYHAFDVDRTAKVFKAYASLATPAPAPTPAPVTPQEELASQVSPGQARVTHDYTPDDGRKMWSVSEMDEFYKAVGRGEYRGRRDEAARIEAEIDKALAENRVQ